MSDKFARLTKPIECAMADGATVLPVGTRIKSVRLGKHGVYTFWASPWGGNSWGEAVTEADLPACTDRPPRPRGRPASESTSAPNGRRGRPTLSTEPATVRLVLKVTDAQAAALEAIAAARELTVPQFMRQALIDSGMPE